MTSIRSRMANLRAVATTRTSRQSMLHVAAQVTSAALGFVTTVLLARVLGVDGFGVYAVLVGYFTFSSVFFDFGIPVATKRLLAVAEASDGSRALLGAGYLGALGIGLVYVVLIYASLPLVGRWVDGDAARLLVLAAPLAIAFPLQEMTLSAAQGLNRIGVSAAMLVLPRALSLAALFLLWRAGMLTPLAAIVSYPAGIMAGVLVLVPVLRPARTRLRAALAALRAEVRAFGRHTYVGRVFDGLTNGFDRMLIAAHAGAASAGMYSIAATMSQPLGMVSRATSASAYRAMATASAMPRRLLRVNVAWAAVGGVALVALCSVLFPLAFTA